MIWQDGETRDWPSMETRADEAARHGEIECPRCYGEGHITYTSQLSRHGEVEDQCDRCEGHGYIPAREAHDCDETPGCPRCYQRTGNTVCGKCCPHAEEGA